MKSAHLGNWREFPNNRWSFQHVDELIPVERISASDVVRQYKSAGGTLPDIQAKLNGQTLTLAEFCEHTHTDALCVLYRGELLHEWYADHYSSANPHIVFSVSKSMTAILAGIFVESGALQPSAPVVDYVPEVTNSAYGDCTVQHVLDMTVSTSFEEDYSATEGDYVRYRSATAWNPPVDGMEKIGLHEFLTTVERGKEQHGYRFRYRSPNSDLLGWIIERAGGKSLARLMAEYIWQPMGAGPDAYITVDQFGASRSAGGICATPHDLLRFGELMLHGGAVDNKRIVSHAWVDDCINNGDKEIWRLGDFALFLPNARYRNQWYQTDNNHNAFFALGIHGQWIYVDPVVDLVLVKLSSMPTPVDETVDLATLNMFEMIADSLVS